MLSRCGVFGFAGMLAIAAGAAFPASAAAADGAYVQSFTFESGPGKSVVFKAQVKILRAGTHTVRGGYVKGGDWHVGGILGTLYYADQTVRGEAGDVVFVTITCYACPPFNRAVNCAVVD